MKIVLKKSDCLDDWYVIERAEHDGREWLEPVGPNAFSYRTSARITDADVEGDAYEMLALARAIRNHSSVSFKRCSVRTLGGKVYFCSPRNSRMDAEVSMEDAQAFATQVFDELGSISHDHQ